MDCWRKRCAFVISQLCLIRSEFKLHCIYIELSYIYFEFRRQSLIFWVLRKEVKHWFSWECCCDKPCFVPLLKLINDSNLQRHLSWCPLVNKMTIGHSLPMDFNKHLYFSFGSFHNSLSNHTNISFVYFMFDHAYVVFFIIFGF